MLIITTPLRTDYYPLLNRGVAAYNINCFLTHMSCVNKRHIVNLGSKRKQEQLPLVCVKLSQLAVVSLSYVQKKTHLSVTVPLTFILESNFQIPS